MFWLEIWGLISTIVLVAGCWLINRKDRRGFWCWIIGNGIGLILHSMVCWWSMAGRDIIFLIMAVLGLRKWRRDADKDAEKTKK